MIYSNCIVLTISWNWVWVSWGETYLALFKRGKKCMQKKLFLNPNSITVNPITCEIIWFLRATPLLFIPVSIPTLHFIQSPPLSLYIWGETINHNTECIKTQHSKYSSGVFSESRGISGHGAPMAGFRLPTAWDSTTLSIMLYHLSKLQETNKQ